MARFTIENSVQHVLNVVKNCQYQNQDGKKADIKKKQRVIAAGSGEYTHANY